MDNYLGAYLHRLDPFAIGFIRWYGLAYLAGFAVGYIWMRSLARRRCTPLAPEAVADFVCVVALGTVLGGRLGYCAFYQPSLLAHFDTNIPFWGALAINQGGMSSHGGMIGMTVAIFWFARRVKLPGLHLMDLIGLVAPIGIVFGRLANFVNGELYGRLCASDLPWGVKFPQDLVEWKFDGSGRLVTPEFQNVLQLAASGENAPSLEQVVVAVQSNDAVAAALEPLLSTRHPSQLYAALLEGLLVLCVVVWLWRKPRKPGVLSGVFFVSYAVVRIFGEQFRMPDSHLGFQALGLTRGQWISIVMLVLGIVFLALTARRKVALMGGIRTPREGELKVPAC
jgi:phosphatidylglycerol:prolipoprotein diacylglycerol transferase